MRLWLVILMLALGLAGAARGQVYAKSAEAAGSDVKVEGDNLEKTVRCNKNTLRILGNGSHLVVMGPCVEVSVEGNQNYIEVQQADRIVTRGSRNNVLYLSPSTKVQDLGKTNSVTPKYQQ